MAGAKILAAAVIAALTVKDGALACSLPSHQSGSSLCSSSAATGSTKDDSTLISHHGSKQHTKPPPCDPSIASSFCSTNILSSLQFGSTPFSKPNFIPTSNYLGSVPTLQTSPPVVTSVYSLAHLNSLMKLMITFLQTFPSICSTGLHGSKSPYYIPLCSSLVPTSTLDKNTGNTRLIGSKLTSMPPISLFTPKLEDKAVSSVLKLPTTPQDSNPCTPSLGSGFDLPSVLPSSLSYGSFTPPKSTGVSGEVPLSTLKTNFEIISTSTLSPVSGKVSELTSEASSPTVPEEFPNIGPVPDKTSVSVMLSGHNQAILNQIIKMILSPKPSPHKPTPLTPSLPIVSTHLTSKKNKSSIPSRVQKPLSKPSICSTPLNLSFCASSLPHLSTSGLVTPTSAPSLEPTFTSGVPYGYNPAFMKLWFKHLFSNLPSLPPPLPSPTSVSQFNIYSVSPSNSNPLPTPTSNNQSSNFNSNASSNKLPDLNPSTSQVPTTTASKPSLDNNANCTNSYYNTLVTPSIPSKTPSLRPCLSSLNYHLSPVQNTSPKPAIVPNQINPCKSSGGSPSDLLNKFLSLTPDSTQKSPGQIPVSFTPFSVPKPTLGPIKTTIPETVPKPTAALFPCSSSPLYLSMTPCHLKHVRGHAPHTPAHMLYPPHLPHSPHVLHKPRPPHLPHPPHSSKRCPLSAASMLGTGCEH